MNILENDIVKINRLAEAAASVISEATVPSNPSDFMDYFDNKYNSAAGMWLDKKRIPELMKLVNTKTVKTVMGDAKKEGEYEKTISKMKAKGFKLFDSEENGDSIDFIFYKSGGSMSKAPPLTEKSKNLAKDEMSLEIDTDDTEGFTQIFSALNKNKDIYGLQDAIYFSGPLSFIEIIRDDIKFKTDDKKEQAIAKLRKEQAYVPGSLKISERGKYKVYDFKIKDTFLEPSLLNNIKVSYY
jgi:hypothetical protein